MKTSRSLVARGSAWTPTAYPPTTRYLTSWAFKADKSSFRSWAIKADSFETVSGDAQFRDGCEPVTRRNTLPVPVGLRLLLFQIGHPADGLVHRIYAPALV